MNIFSYGAFEDFEDGFFGHGLIVYVEYGGDVSCQIVIASLKDDMRLQTAEGGQRKIIFSNYSAADRLPCLITVVLYIYYGSVIHVRHGCSILRSLLLFEFRGRIEALLRQFAPSFAP